MNKKIIPVTLALSTMLQISALAYTDDSKIALENRYAVSRLSEYSIINGNVDGSFAPSNNVKRSEMAKMIYVMQNVGSSSDASSYANTSSTFSDINGHWASNYIKYCSSKGIINGKSSTSFAPEDNITGLEAAKMVLIALGVDAEKGGLVGADWDSNTQMLANSFNIFYDVTADTTKPISREVAAQIISNALSAKTAVYDSSAYEKYTKSSTTLADSYKLKDVSTNSARAIYDEISDAGLVSRAMSGQTEMISSFYGLSGQLSDAHLSLTMVMPGNDEVFIAKVTSGNLPEVKAVLDNRIEDIKKAAAGYVESMIIAGDLARYYVQGDYIMFYVSAEEANYAKAETIFKNMAK